MRERGLPWVIPLYAVLGLTLVVPAAYTLYLSLFDYRLLTGQMAFSGLRNYGAVLGDPAFLRATWNTLVYTASAVSLELALGLAVALLVHQPRRGLRPVRALLIAPWVLSPVVAGLLWRMLLHSNYGLFNYMLTWLGLPMGSVQWLTSPHLAMLSVVLAEVWQNAPFAYLVLYAGLQGLPAEPYEAARVDGAGRWQTFVLITLPQLMPAVAVAATFRIIFAFREFTIPWTLTAGGPGDATTVLSIHLYRKLLQFFDLGSAATVGWLMTLLTALLSAGFLGQFYRSARER